MAWGMKNYTIQLFGSSIIEGRIGVERAADRWYEIMRRQLCEMFPATCFAVYNGAVGGKSARVLMERFDGELFGHTPDLCIAMFGWNNCRMDDPAQRVDLPELKELMEKFLTHLPQKTRVVGVINQPVIDEWHATFKNPNYDPIRAEYGGFNAYHDFERSGAGVLPPPRLPVRRPRSADGGRPQEICRQGRHPPLALRAPVLRRRNGQGS